MTIDGDDIWPFLQILQTENEPKWTGKKSNRELCTITKERKTALYLSFSLVCRLVIQ